MNKKRDRFIKVGERRVNNALKSINLIGNLANKSNYEYSPNEIKKIERVLKTELANTIDKFHNHNGASKKGFTLK